MEFDPERVGSFVSMMRNMEHQVAVGEDEAAALPVGVGDIPSTPG